MNWYLVGIFAAVLTTFGFIPQIIKMYMTKSSKDVSIVTLFQFGLGTSLWALYGIHIKDLIVIIANITSFITIFIAIVVYSHYAKKIE